MIKDFSEKSICYSIGVGADVTWDYEMAERGIDIYQVDDAHAEPPCKHSRFRFRAQRLSASEANGEITLSKLLRENGHVDETDIILKVDIEGDEWDIFDLSPSDTLIQFKQIICEFHDFHLIEDVIWRQRAERVLGKIVETHAPVHWHGNNYAGTWQFSVFTLPHVLEVTFVRRKDYAVEKDYEPFPRSIDRPNCPDRTDIMLRVIAS